jgi:hypothetical protein
MAYYSMHVGHMTRNLVLRLVEERADVMVFAAMVEVTLILREVMLIALVVPFQIHQQKHTEHNISVLVAGHG